MFADKIEFVCLAIGLSSGFGVGVVAYAQYKLNVCITFGNRVSKRGVK